MARTRRRVRAIDLPTIRDQMRGLAASLFPDEHADDPGEVRELVRQLRRGDFALWWVTRPMTILAAHAAQTIPAWDSIATRPAPAGIICWEGGTGIGLPVWEGTRIEPRAVEAVGLLWWTTMDAVRLESLVWASDSPGFTGPADTLLTPLDRAGLSPLTDWQQARDRDMLVADLWAASVTLALEPKVGTLTNRRRLPGMVWPDRPKHAPTISIVALRERGIPTSTDRPEETGDKAWHLTHQHRVRGHWRQQACGPGRKLRRPVFVGSYLKGPAGADLVETDLVHVWRR